MGEEKRDKARVGDWGEGPGGGPVVDGFHFVTVPPRRATSSARVDSVELFIFTATTIGANIASHKNYFAFVAFYL